MSLAACRGEAPLHGRSAGLAACRGEAPLHGRSAGLAACRGEAPLHGRSSGRRFHYPLWAGFIMSVMQAKVPAIVATGLICLVLGGGVGAGIMSYASKSDPQAQAAPAGEG